MESIIAYIRLLAEQPLPRQLAVLFGLAISISVGVGIILWAQSEDYVALYSDLDTQDAAQVLVALESIDVKHRVDERSGLISVPADRKHEIRLRLANQGLPAGGQRGFETLYASQEFGTSSFMETARFHRALEEELSQSIATLDSVRAARVHLAIPKRSTFIRSQKKVNASVLINLKPGRYLNEDQLAGIVYLVASSVPELDPKGVTVVDQKGGLLSGREKQGSIAEGLEQHRFQREVEQKYIDAIREILAPVLGEDSFSAQVSADLNFTTVEETSERFDPNSTVLRSEQMVSETGVPVIAAGPVEVLSDAPPGDAQAEEQKMVRSTRNYEVDHSISRIREAPGSVKRLSVAVVVDHRSETLEDGTVQRSPLDPEQMAAIDSLVKEAVGYVAARGDSVEVRNVPFIETEYAPELPEIPVWQQPWVQEFAKVGMAFLAILILILAVVRPLIRSVAAPPAPEVQEGEFVDAELLSELGAGHAPRGGTNERGEVEVPLLTEYERALLQVKAILREDPDRLTRAMQQMMAADS